MLFSRYTKLRSYFSRSLLTIFSNEIDLFLIIHCPSKPTIYFFVSLPHWLTPSYVIYSILNYKLLKIFPRYRSEFAISLLATALFLSKHSLPVRHFEIRNALFWLFWPIFVYILSNVSITALPTSFVWNCEANRHCVSLYKPFLVFSTNIHWFSRMFNWYGEE